MKVKLLELRDRATFIPVFAFRCQPDGRYEPKPAIAMADEEAQQYLLSRAGFGILGDSPLVVMGRLECAGVANNCTYDPYSWNDRTFTTAHKYIQKNFDALQDGDVIDVEFILGETKAKKESEKL